MSARRQLDAARDITIVSLSSNGADAESDAVTIGAAAGSGLKADAVVDNHTYSDLGADSGTLSGANVNALGKVDLRANSCNSARANANAASGGAFAGGAALWGQVANWTGIQGSLAIAAVSAVVVADGHRALAQARADELARMAWERRAQYLVRKTPIAEAVRQALAGADRPFVFADSSDSVTGGAYGDGNILLRTLLESSYGDTALLTLTDPEAAAACHTAGVGSKVTVAVGGKLAPAFYRPVTVTGRVRKVTDGKYVCELPPTPIDVGRAAVLQVGGISLALSERPAPTIDQEIYRHLGLAPRETKIVQVKSPGGFRAVYGPFAAGIFEIDTPGPTDSELTRLPFRKIRRPLWPFDPELSDPW